MEKTRLTVEMERGKRDEAKAQAYAERKSLKEKVGELVDAWLSSIRNKGGQGGE